MERTRKVLLISFTSAVFLCIAVFFWVAMTMSHRSEESVSEIGMIYMSEMNEQIKQKFTAIVDLRMAQVEGIMERTSMKNADYGADMLEDMALSAGIRRFSFLGLYTQGGTCEVVYGTPIEIRDGQSFLNEVAIYGRKISSGVDEDGVPVMVLGVKAAYKMQDGGTSSALVAAIPMSYLESVLVLEREDSLIYSHVIREDGSYVIRTGDASLDNYFDRIMNVFQECRGKQPEDYSRELKAAMAAREDYSALIQVDGIHRHIYCTPLPECDWYLVTVMPYGVLDDALADLAVRGYLPSQAAVQ